MPEFDLFDKLADSAQKLGAMQATAVWAFVCMLMALHIWRTFKRHEAYDKQWQAIRMKEAEGAIKLSIAVDKLDDDVKQTSDRLNRIETILDERIPKGGRHV
jgi:hypothetical protein